MSKDSAENSAEAAGAKPAEPKGAQPTKRDLKDALQIWGTVFKGVGALVVVAGAVVGYLDYRQRDDQRHADETARSQQRESEEAKHRSDLKKQAEDEVNQRQKDYLLRLYEERKPLLMEASRMAAQIATADQLADAKPAIKRFKELYYGELCLVEDSGVADKMIAFKQKLDQLLHPSVALQKRADAFIDLRKGALELSKACQHSLDLGAVFNIQPGDPEEKSKFELEPSPGAHKKIAEKGK
jgi:hypothetical protein